jgi:hypothetical protein
MIYCYYYYYYYYCFSLLFFSLLFLLLTFLLYIYLQFMISKQRVEGDDGKGNARGTADCFNIPIKREGAVFQEGSEDYTCCMMNV